MRKELRLQQLTFAVSALYICGWISTLVLHPIAGHGDIEDSLLILTVVNGAIVALLSGSLASAEERHLGVLESQVLMPTPIGRQWAVKVGIVFGLCALLAMGLPAMLTLVSYGGRYFSVTVPFMASVLFTATVGLYRVLGQWQRPEGTVDSWAGRAINLRANSAARRCRTPGGTTGRRRTGGRSAWTMGDRADWRDRLHAPGGIRSRQSSVERSVTSPNLATDSLALRCSRVRHAHRAVRSMNDSLVQILPPSDV